MRIEVLYVPGCPNYEPTLKQVEKVLVSELEVDKVCTVPISTEAEAKLLEFPGSPTVRVNGTDVEPERSFAVGLTCRIYRDGAGVPSEALIPDAIRRSIRCE